jgi:hypothetical protein
MSALSRDVDCFWFCSATQNQRLLKESIQIDAKIRENTPTCDVGTSCSPTSLGGVTSLSRKCSSLQQEVRVFSSFALFFDWGRPNEFDRCQLRNSLIGILAHGQQMRRMLAIRGVSYCTVAGSGGGGGGGRHPERVQIIIVAAAGTVSTRVAIIFL